MEVMGVPEWFNDLDEWLNTSGKFSFYVDKLKTFKVTNTLLPKSALFFPEENIQLVLPKIVCLQPSFNWGVWPSGICLKETKLMKTFMSGVWQFQALALFGQSSELHMVTCPLHPCQPSESVIVNVAQSRQEISSILTKCSLVLSVQCHSSIQSTSPLSLVSCQVETNLSLLVPIVFGVFATFVIEEGWEHQATCKWTAIGQRSLNNCIIC